MTAHTAADDDGSADVERRGGRRLLTAAATVAMIGVLGVAAELIVHGSDVRSWGVGLDMAVAAAAGIASYAVWRRWWSDRRAHVLLFTLGATAWSLSQLLGIVHRAAHGVSTWWSTGALVAAPGLFLAGGWQRLLRFPRILRAALSIDAAVMAVATNFVIWELWLRDGLAGAGAEAMVRLGAVPMIGVASVAIVLAMMLQQPSGTLTFMIAGFGSVTVAATIEAATIEATLGAVTAGDAHPVLVVVRYLWLIAAAAGLVRLAGCWSASVIADNHRPEVVRMVAVYVPSTVSMLLATQRYIFGSYPVSVVSGALAVTFVALVMLDQLARAWESSEYSERLTSTIADLGATEHRLRMLLDDLPEAVLVTDATGRILQVNSVTAQMMGRPADELIGSPVASLAPPEYTDFITQMWQQMHHGDLDIRLPRMRLPLAPPADPSVVVEVDAILPIRDRDNVVISLRDISSSVREAEAHRQTRERFGRAFRGAPTGMALSTSNDGRISDANEALLRMLAMTREQLVGLTLRDITHPDDWDRSGAMFMRAISGSIDGYDIAKRYVRADGSTVWGQTWVSVLASEGETMAIIHVHDITEQRRSAEQLRWAATHDELTRLPNRSQFTAELTERLASSPVGCTAVLFIDLDNFKVVNDSLGHSTGDQLLRGMTQRLRAVLRDHDMLSRFGGDEFMVLLSDYQQDESPADAAQRLRREIARPLTIDGVELFVTGSIGIAVADRAELTASDLLRDADAAMYRAKARGRDCVEVFAQGVHDASVTTLRTTNELRRGLERDEVVPYYQPIVDLPTGLLMGFEVLARWRHPDRGLLGPDQFLPMAEETGLINDVGETILRASLVQLGRWRESIPALADISIAVNVSGRQLLDRGFDEQVSEALAESGVPAGSLWLEITETALMADVKLASIALRELRSIGLHLSVDDFGTGYSSLTYLKRFPVEAIKVDRSFVNGLGIDAEDSTIVEAVINLGHSLGLTVVAEGVETPLQLSRLRELGCDRGQGYLFGRPRPSEIIEAELRVS